MYFPPFKMRNSDNIIDNSAAISSLVGVFMSLSYDADLKSASLLNQAVHKLPPNMKEPWSLFTIKNHWGESTRLDFNDCLKEKAQANSLVKQISTKAKTKDNNISATKNKVASKLIMSNTQQSEPRKQVSLSSTPINSRWVAP